MASATQRPSNFGSGPSWKGNAKGPPLRSKSIVDFIRRNTNNGRKMAQFYLRVLEDEKEPTHLRLLAASKLEERAYGKAPQVIEENRHVEHSLIMVLDRPKDGSDGRSNRMIEIFRTPGQLAQIITSDNAAVEKPEQNTVPLADTPDKLDIPST